jgi:hypothetical protein
MLRLFAGALCATFAASGMVLAAPAGKLAPTEIQTTFFDGKPFSAATPKNIKYTMVFTADGKMTRDPTGQSGVKGEGTWKLSKGGFCTTWQNSTGNCFTMASSGANKWSVFKGTSVIGTWSK